ncbi:MAG TPA: DegQ family serine endoprotease [Thermodesulfobacteriota bacterium]|nr:DegQ family serine endoprotease [Thermodesulfobacteriota bacterium]
MDNITGKKRSGITGIKSIIIVGIASLLLGVMLTARFGITPSTDAQSFWKEKMGKAELLQLEPNSFVRLAKELNPVVVNISMTQVVKQKPMVPFPEFRNPFEEEDEFRLPGEAPEREFKRQSAGSGFIINKEGYILTNSHVVENAEEIIVTLSDKKEKEYKAKIVGKDVRLDVALIKIDANGDLSVAALGDSDKLEIGEWVVAIGNPFGLGHTVTAGIVSAKGRVIGAGPYDNFIQTDAAINPGNSGGPLFNLKGEVVGINTAIIAGGQGVGFATPINMVKDILIQLKEKGSVTRGWIGVGIQEVTPDLAKSFGLKDKQGALVSSVQEGEPADKAGIKPGDIIVEFDGKEINEVSDLPRTVASIAPGKTVKVKIIRDGKEKDISITVGKMKEEEEAAAVEGKEEGTPEKRFGLSVQSITPEIAQRMDLKDTKGVLVVKVKPNSPVAASGIKNGDIIKQVNKKEIKDLKEYKEAMKAVSNDDTVLFQIVSGGRTFYVAIKVKAKD